MVKNKVRIAQLITVILVLLFLTSMLGIIVYLSKIKETQPPAVQQTSQSTVKPISANGLDNAPEDNEWKTYKNDKYKFKVEYPPIYLYDENLLGGTEYSINLGLKFEDNNSQRKAGRNFELTIDKNENGLDNFIREANETRGQIEQSSEFIDTEKVAGFSTKIIKACDQGSNCNKIIYFTNGKYIYVIYLEKYFNLDIANKEILDRMLASFEFETDSKPIQPTMPTAEDEASKSPEELVKDFYEWYIGNTNFRLYQAFQLNIKPIDLEELVKKSPFISSAYTQNMEKKEEMYERVLCTTDTEFNVVKEYGKADISGDDAEMEIKRGYTKGTKFENINIKLKKEKGQWKIDDVVCKNI